MPPPIEQDLAKALGPDFQPGPKDVICTGRQGGKAVYIHNHHFRKLIDDHVEQYNQCHTRIDRSILFNRIVRLVRKRSPLGGFVKFSEEHRCYVEIGNQVAREKVGQALRKAWRVNKSKEEIGSPPPTTKCNVVNDAKIAAVAPRDQESPSSALCTVTFNSQQQHEHPPEIADGLLEMLSVGFLDRGNISASCSCSDISSIAQLEFGEQDVLLDNNNSSRDTLDDVDLRSIFF